MPGKFGRYKERWEDPRNYGNESRRYKRDGTMSQYEVDIKDSHQEIGMHCRRGNHDKCTMLDTCRCACHPGNHN
jgi:hypothetical protein